MENKKIEYIELPEDPHVNRHSTVDIFDDPMYPKYLETVRASENFVAEYIDPKYRVFKPYDSSCFSNPDFDRLARFAVEEFNRIKGAKLGFVRIVRLTARGWGTPNGMSRLCYFTLECDDGKIYEAKVCRFDPGIMVLNIFRPAKHYPWIRESGYSDDRKGNLKIAVGFVWEYVDVDNENQDTKSGVSSNGSKSGGKMWRPIFSRSFRFNSGKNGNSDGSKNGSCEIEVNHNSKRLKI